MMRLSDLVGPQDYLRLPQIESNQVDILCYHDFHDGPLNGILLYEGEKYWFENCEWKPRRFLVIRLSPQQLAEAPVDTEPEFLEEYAGPTPELSGNAVIGWFEW